MCKTATVKTAQIPGYTKGMLDHDVCDSFYLDNHIWNAVYLDNHWYLLDPTYDAGYIKTSTVTFISLAKYYLSGKQSFKQVPCYKFVQRPTLDYYLKSGLYFSYDHLPSNDEWQLNENPLTVLDFQQDSAFYYSEKKDNIYSDHFDKPGREILAKASMLDEMMENGFVSTKLNDRN